MAKCILLLLSKECSSWCVALCLCGMRLWGSSEGNGIIQIHVMFLENILWWQKKWISSLTDCLRQYWCQWSWPKCKVPYTNTWPYVNHRESKVTALFSLLWSIISCRLQLNCSHCLCGSLAFLLFKMNLPLYLWSCTKWGYLEASLYQLTACKNLGALVLCGYPWLPFQSTV